MTEAVVVEVGACRCPGSPHPSDTVSLEPELTLAMASGAMYAINTEADGTNSTLMRLLTEAYLPAGIREWTFVDDEGEPVKIDREAMERLIPFDAGGLEVSEKADALYADRLMAPLVKRLSTLRKRGRTVKPTSPIPLSGRRPRKSSGPSSPDVSAGRQSAAPAQ
jgi:hypothetical protein